MSIRIIGKNAIGLTVLALTGSGLMGCGNGGQPGSALNNSNAANSVGQEFAFGALSGRAALSNPPVTTNGSGATITGLKGTISSLYLNDTAPRLEETRIAFINNRDGNDDIYAMNADGTNQLRLTNNTAIDTLPSWRSDGKKIAFASSRDGNDEIYTMNANGSGLTRLTNDVAADMRPAWSAFVRQRTLIGSQGTLSIANVAGFLFSQGNGPGGTGQGEVINAIVAFDGNPRSGVLLSSQSVPNNTGPNLIFVVEADSPNTITLLSYHNNPDYFKPYKVIGSGTGIPTANGALISFSAITGKVVAVLPYSGTRGAGKPAVTSENGQRVCRGSFVGVFDATGKNLAPGGAKEVRFDGKTGLLLSAR